MLTSVFLLQSHIEIIQGYATFTDGPQPTVDVNGKKFTAPHILIATGGVPTVPQESQIPGESPKSQDGQGVHKPHRGPCLHWFCLEKGQKR